MHLLRLRPQLDIARRAVALLTIFTLGGLTLVISADAAEPELAIDSASVEERLTNEIKYLSSDELEGRGVGLKGLDLAADKIRDEFKKAGLDVTAVDGGAFQPFNMTTGSKLGDVNELTFIRDGKVVKLEYGTDFVTCSFGSSGPLTGEVVFCGYGIKAPKQGYDDFAGVDLKDKIALIMRRVPQQDVPGSLFVGPHGNMSRVSSLTSKVSNAFRAGAKAVLFVNDTTSPKVELKKKIAATERTIAKLQGELDVLKEEDARKRADLANELARADQRLQLLAKSDPEDTLMKFGYGGRAGSRAIPIAHLTVESANRLLAPVIGKTVAEIEATIDETLKPMSQSLSGWDTKGEVSVAKLETEVKNVIGVWEGEGPLSDETIVIGAHYDHVGLGGAGSLLPGSTDVHNGADDNASGTAGLIELARQLTRRGKPFPRRLVFIAFTAEERGLIGSAHYCKNPVFPLENTVAMFNMDMIGRLRGDKLTVFGTGTATEFDALADKYAEQFELKVIKKPEGFGPSDHSSFYAKKIPVLHLFTGTHGEYHRPTDDWPLINYNGIRRIVDYLELIVIDTVNAPERPTYREVKDRAKIARSGSRPYFGSIPDFGQEKPGYAISGVAPDSPAAKGGLKGGDIIVKFGKDEIANLDDFDLALRQFSAGDRVDVTVDRKGKKVTLKVTLGEPR